jgi:hypothetical protein
MDSSTFIIHLVMQCDFQHSLILKKVSFHLHPTYCEMCCKFEGSWILRWFPGLAAAWVRWCWTGTQLGYLDGQCLDNVVVLGRNVKKKEEDLECRNLGLWIVFKPAFTGMTTLPLTTAPLTDQCLFFIPSSSHKHRRPISSLWGGFITTDMTKYLHLMEHEP